MRNKCYSGRLLIVVLLWMAVLTAGTPAQENEPVVTSLFDMFGRLDYFPLEVGNEWTYRDGSQTLKVQVLKEIQETNGRTYFEVAGYFPNDTLKVRKLRWDPWLNRVVEYNPKGTDFLWYRFARGWPPTWRFESDYEITCITGSQLSLFQNSKPLQVPAGSFSQLMRIDFKSVCRDGGIDSEYFAPEVGLVRRILNTIAGPRNVDLISAKVGSRRYPRSPVGVEVSIAQPLYYNNLMPPVRDPAPTLEATLIVRNETDLPMTFEFSSSQRFDFAVRDAAGKELLRWSDDKKFMAVLGREVVKAGQLSYSASLKLQTREGKPLSEGLYTLEGWLTNSVPDSKRILIQGSMVFQIKNVH